MKRKAILLLLLFTFLWSAEKELIVPLATKGFLSSVSLMSLSSPQFNKTYLETLHDILLFDINRNGSCCIIEGENPDFFIELDLSGKALFVLITLRRGGITKPLGPYSLTETLASDRRVIHRLADDLTAIMTGKKGIASTRILYAVQFPEKTEEGWVWKSDIWEADYDGHNARQVTFERSYCISPVFFPVEGSYTENKFLYVNYKKGQPKIYLGQFDQVKGSPMVSLRGNQLLPAISPKGDLIAFISDASGRADLFVQPFSKSLGPIGKPIQVFSYPHSVQASPTFRPDGKKIAFVSDKEGTPRIFLIDTPTPGKTTSHLPSCITKKTRHNTCPAWSPDGTKLAYSAMIDGSRQIMVYDFLTREEIQLTNGKSHKENPIWAQNSLHIIYNTVDPSSSELFIVNLKQKESYQITNGPGKKHYPAWELARGPL